ncbi:MAG: LA_2272 family surface repeat-containing protein [Brevinematales bacterium]
MCLRRLLIGFLCFFGGIVWGEEQPSIVVMEIENRSGETSLDSRTLTEIVELHVVNMRRFRVVERQKLDRILSEQKLNQSGLTEKEVARVGMLVGASKAIVGSFSKFGKNYLLLLRLIDTSTATIDEVAELRTTSLEDLLDRSNEPVKELFQRTRQMSASLEKEQPQAKTAVSSPATEETDEDALTRLIREAKEKLRQRQAPENPEDTTFTRSSPREEDEDLTASSIKAESDAVWKSLKNNRWGAVLQLGIGEDAQIYPRKWNFIGVGFGLLSLENKLYIGWEWAFLVPKAYVMAGYQQGFFPYAEGYLLGVQHGLINRVGISALGWQFGFLNIVEHNMLGFQQGFINNGKELKGVQVGFINVAKEVRGVQIGFLNTTRRLYGVQLGVLNVSRENGLPFMIGLNIGF